MIRPREATLRDALSRIDRELARQDAELLDALLGAEVHTPAARELAGHLAARAVARRAERPAPTHAMVRG